MRKLDRASLWSLERYAQEREQFRVRVMAHKKLRRVSLGPHATLIFEDTLTMRYQVQEMLRTERIFEPAEIEAEIEAYNPLIPDGHNLKATLMIEYADVAERREALGRMVGIEHRVWVRAHGHDPVFGIANEDMDRSDDDKTAAVHFLRFEFDAAMIRSLKEGTALSMGIDHDELPYRLEVAAASRETLVRDFD